MDKARREERKEKEKEGRKERRNDERKEEKTERNVGRWARNKSFNLGSFFFKWHTHSLSVKKKC